MDDNIHVAADMTVTPAKLHQKLQEHFPLVERIVAFESGETDEDETLELFQYLVNTGQAWTLQGAYVRMAMSLIQRGLIGSPEMS